MATDPERDPRSASEFAALLSQYIEELNSTGFVDPEEISARHPELGAALLEDLKTYASLRREEDAGAVLGTLGDYTLRRQLGRGGMGVVYDAWESSMERAVALKVLPAGAAADERTFQRFLREARTAGKLSHPNVVPVHAVGIREHTPYYAMELIEGETLAQILLSLEETEPEAETVFGKKDRPGYFEKLAETFAEVADGLQHAHSRGVVHRDIKPSNLILDHSGDPGGSRTSRLRILDFGLAHLEGQESLTLSGDCLGTPLYMSPEQARRKKIPLDHRTDVYSLGATIYEALCGRPPFRGRDNTDTLSQIIERDPVEPRTLNPRVPKDLETIVLKCLRKDAADRYGTAEALAQDLRRFVRRDPIEARPEPRWSRARRLAWRRRAHLAAAALSVSLVVAALLLAGRHTADLRRRSWAEYQDRVFTAVLQRDLGRTIARLENMEATRFNELIPHEPAWVSGSAPLHPVHAALEGFRSAAAILPSEAAAYYHQACALLLLGRREEALAQLERALERDPALLPARAERASLLGSSEPSGGSAGWETAWLSAYRAYRERRWDEAARACQEFLALTEEEPEPYVGARLEMLAARGQAYLKAGQLDQAVEDFAVLEYAWPKAIEPSILKGKAYLLNGKASSRREHLARAEQVFEGAFARAAEQDQAALLIAYVHAGTGEFESGLHWIEKVTDARLRDLHRMDMLARLWRFDEAASIGERLAAETPEDARVHSELCKVLYPLGRWEQAATHGKIAIGLDPSLPYAHLDLGQALFELGQEAEAVVLLKSEVRVQPWNPLVRHDAAQLLMFRGLLKKAEAMAREAILLDRDYADGYQLLGVILQRTGRIEDARVSFETALRLDPTLPYPYGSLGVLHAGQGRFAEAAAAFGEHIRLWPRHRRTSWVHRALGDLRRREGRLDEALEEYLQAIALQPDSIPAHRDLATLLRARGKAAAWPRLDRWIAALEEIAGRGGPVIRRTLALARLKGSTPDYGKALEDLLSALEAADESGLDLRALTGTLEEILVDLALAETPAPTYVEWSARLPPYEAIKYLLDVDRGASGRVVASARVQFDAPHVRTTCEPRHLYFEGRALEAGGEVSEAATCFAAAAALDPGRVEPLVAFCRALRKAGAATEAEAVLRSRMDSASIDERSLRDLRDLWAAVCLADLREGPREILGVLGANARGAMADLRWLLERLEAREPIRINCGGEEYETSGQLPWGRDRFFRGGAAATTYREEISATEDDVLYHSQRRFLEQELSPAGYRVPLPRGKYTVTFHFAEVDPSPCGLRRFDVLLEGGAVRLEWESAAANFATAEARSVELRVDDGLLEVEFVEEFDSPTVAGIEIVSSG